MKESCTYCHRCWQWQIEKEKNSEQNYISDQFNAYVLKDILVKVIKQKGKPKINSGDIDTSQHSPDGLIFAEN